MSTPQAGEETACSSNESTDDDEALGLEEEEADSGLGVLPDAVLTHVLSFVGAEAAYPNCLGVGATAAARHFHWMRTTLPLVCKRWSTLLAQPAVCVWDTVHVFSGVETGSSHSRTGSHRQQQQLASPGLSKRSVDTLLGSSPPVAGGGGWGSAHPGRTRVSNTTSLATVSHGAATNQLGVGNSSTATSASSTFGSSPPTALAHIAVPGAATGITPGTGTARSSLSAAVLRSERVIEWIARRTHSCHVLLLNLSNINHDFSPRSMDRLLSLVKPGLRVLRLVDGPGPGRQEGYEILSTLKNMQELHIEAIPQEFLYLTLPYLSMLPCLRALHFQPDLSAYPSPAKLAPLPASLQRLELCKVWLEALPVPLVDMTQHMTSAAHGGAGGIVGTMAHSGLGGPSLRGGGGAGNPTGMTTSASFSSTTAPSGVGGAVILSSALGVPVLGGTSSAPLLLPSATASAGLSAGISNAGQAQLQQHSQAGQQASLSRQASVETTAPSATSGASGTAQSAIAAAVNVEHNLQLPSIQWRVGPIPPLHFPGAAQHVTGTNSGSSQRSMLTAEQHILGLSPTAGAANATGGFARPTAGPQLEAVSFKECHLTVAVVSQLACTPSVTELSLTACTVAPDARELAPASLGFGGLQMKPVPQNAQSAGGRSGSRPGAVGSPDGVTAAASSGRGGAQGVEGGRNAAFCSSLRSLCMANCGLQGLSPLMLQALSQLRELDLHGNAELGASPDSIPSELGLLHHLSSLDLSGCGLTVLPAPVAALPSLEHLSLELNSLSGLPSTLACCNTLRVANISQNRLPALPSCILACTRLEQLVLSSGPVAGTHDFDRLHKQLPRLRRLQVKGATYDCKAVRNLLRLGQCSMQEGSQLQIEIEVTGAAQAGTQGSRASRYT